MAIENKEMLELFRKAFPGSNPSLVPEPTFPLIHDMWDTIKLSIPVGYEIDFLGVAKLERREENLWILKSDRIEKLKDFLGGEQPLGEFPHWSALAVCIGDLIDEPLDKLCGPRWRNNEVVRSHDTHTTYDSTTDVFKDEKYQCGYWLPRRLKK